MRAAHLPRDYKYSNPFAVCGGELFIVAPRRAIIRSIRRFYFTVRILIPGVYEYRKEQKKEEEVGGGGRG